jgi:hypothetical protein
MVLTEQIDAGRATAVARNYLEKNYGNVNMLLFRIEYARPNDVKDQFHVLCSLLHSFGSVNRLYYHIKVDINDGGIIEVSINEEKDNASSIEVIDKKEHISEKEFYNKIEEESINRVNESNEGRLNCSESCTNRGINKILKENIKTQIFNSYDDFFNKEDKLINGVSKEFTKVYSNYEKMNDNNRDCWNCVDCEGCNSCWSCDDCKGCVGCYHCIGLKGAIDLNGVIL